MNTLAHPTTSSVLDRLFAEAKATDAQLVEMTRHLTPEQIASAVSNPDADFRDFYHRARELHLAVSRSTGLLLYMLARASKARHIVEFGTSFGVSTIFLAAALADNGGGRLIGSEFEPSKIERARENLRAAGLLSGVEIREGDALETLSRDLPETIDLVLLDGAKPLYGRVLALLEGRLREGALVVADNAEMCPDYVARVRSPASGYLSVPFGADVELSVRAA